MILFREASVLHLFDVVCCQNSIFIVIYKLHALLQIPNVWRYFHILATYFKPKNRADKLHTAVPDRYLEAGVCTLAPHCISPWVSYPLKSQANILKWR